MRVAFFDVDHTITRHSTAWHFLLLGAKRGLFPVRSLFLVPYYFVLYRFGRLRGDIFSRDFPYLKGKTRERLQTISRASFEYSLMDDIHAEARALIKQLKASGVKIVLATSSIDIIVEPLAEYLEVDGLIANSFEFHDGVSTGRFLAAPVFGAEKRRRAIEYAEREGIRPDDCTFYSDSINDLPLLEAVGHPVVVNPDGRLRRLSARKGWKNVRFGR